MVVFSPSSDVTSIRIDADFDLSVLYTFHLSCPCVAGVPELSVIFSTFSTGVTVIVEFSSVFLSHTRQKEVSDSVVSASYFRFSDENSGVSVTKSRNEFEVPTLRLSRVDMDLALTKFKLYVREYVFSFSSLVTTICTVLSP